MRLSDFGKLSVLEMCTISLLIDFTMQVSAALTVPPMFVLEALYQFSSILPNDYAPLIVDSVMCVVLLPPIMIGFAANIIVDRFGRDDVACALTELAESRQQLLRWLAHEARVPLNSLYMGLALLNDESSALRRALPADHDELTTLGQCGSAGTSAHRLCLYCQ